MRYITLIAVFFSLNGYAQKYKDYQLTTKGDTINIIDVKGFKQGKWINRVEDNMGEPGFQEEGSFKNNEKEGPWKLYSLMGDPIGEEFYSWGQKSKKQQYFDIHGNLIREENWLAITPDNMYDTIQVPDWKKDPTGNVFRRAIVKLEGNALKDGAFKYYDDRGRLIRSDKYKYDRLIESMVITFDFVTGKIQGKEQIRFNFETGKPEAKAGYEKPKEPAKPKQVQDFEKLKKGKKTKKFQDGSTGG
jgi:antitoxin component YwqK of YwqJK toxin-antitoxin module